MIKPVVTKQCSQPFIIVFLGACALLAGSGGCINTTPSTGSAGTGGHTSAGGSAQGGTNTGGSAMGGSSGTGGSNGTGGSASTGGTSGSGGSSAAGGSSGAGGSTSQYANWATIKEIASIQCAGGGCHNGDTQPTLAGNGLTDAKLYQTLTTFQSTLCGNRVLVKPGAPDQSAFYLAQTSQCGNALPQMPLGCVDNCTPADYLEGVKEWIANGAPQQ